MFKVVKAFPYGKFDLCEYSPVMNELLENLLRRTVLQRGPKSWT